MKSAGAMILALAVALAIFTAPAASARLPQANAHAATTGKSYEFDVDAATQWVDTEIDLRAGEKLRIAATGTITYPASDSSKSKARSFGPDGIPRGFADLIHQYAVADGGHGALIGRLGPSDGGGQPFAIGASSDFEAPVADRFFLGINQSQKDASTAQGSFHVTIAVVDAGLSGAASAVVGGPPETRIAGITTPLLDEIPRRVSDPQGNPGDMVNVLLLGTEDQVVGAFTAAGWVHVDSTVKDTVLAGVVDSIEKKDYLTMPMSTLYLFNHPQDYGFAHAEPVRVAMSRNHLRVWKSPFTAGERQVWCVAATHDIGFERDERNNSVTHKIDPALDGEREYVNETLSSTGLVVARDHVAPTDPLIEATGGSFHSDGRILVLVLKSATSGGNK
jgi:hypothetical protein